MDVAASKVGGLDCTLFKKTGDKATATPTAGQP